MSQPRLRPSVRVSQGCNSRLCGLVGSFRVCVCLCGRWVEHLSASAAGWQLGGTGRNQRYAGNSTNAAPTDWLPMCVCVCVLSAGMLVPTS